MATKAARIARAKSNGRDREEIAITEHLRRVLAEARGRQNLSQHGCDALCGFPIGSTAAIENGYRIPSYKTLRALVRGLEVSPSDLLML